MIGARLGLQPGNEARQWFCAADYHHRHPAYGGQVIVLCLSLA